MLRSYTQGIGLLKCDAWSQSHALSSIKRRNIKLRRLDSILLYMNKVVSDRNINVTRTHIYSSIESSLLDLIFRLLIDKETWLCDQASHFDKSIFWVYDRSIISSHMIKRFWVQAWEFTISLLCASQAMTRTLINSFIKS